MKNISTIILFLSLVIPSCSFAKDEDKSTTAEQKDIEQTNIEKTNIKQAVFAAGCFWCLEAAFDKLDGVTSTTSGYSGGKTKDPTYKEVSSGETGHIEVLKVEYDSKKTSYAKLLKHFWKNVDPLDSIGQFCDKGSQYIGAILPANNEEKKAANESLAKVQKLFQEKVETKILDLKKFYPAEDYHQDYYKKNAFRYKFYSTSCGRKNRLEEVWKNKDFSLN